MPDTTLRWSDDREGLQSATFAYDVINRNNTTEARAAVPYAKNSQHPRRPELKCDAIDAQAVGFRFYRVTVSFSIPESGSEHPPDKDSNPTASLPKFRWRAGLTSEPVELDADGVAIVMSNLEPVDPPLSEGFHTMFLQARRWENAPFNAATAQSMYNAVNDNALQFQGTTFPMGTMCMVNMEPADAYTIADKFIEVEYTFEANPHGFKRRYLDKGVTGWVRDGGDLYQSYLYQQSTSGMPQPIGIPVLLDGQGVPIRSGLKVRKHSGEFADPAVAPAIPGVEVEQKGPGVFIKRWTRPRRNFSVFGFFN